MPSPRRSAVSRRHVLAAGTGLLAGFGLAAILPGVASAAPAVADSPAPKTDLALFRPVQVSSTDYAATPAEFAVDGLAQVGVKGSGWRADARRRPVDRRRPAGARAGSTRSC